MAKSTEVAKTTATSTEVAGYDYGAYAGKGYDDLGSGDYSIPFINILQSNSPEVEDDDFPDAKAGLLFNNVTKELFSTLPFMIAKIDKRFVEWKPRDAGGGYIGDYEPANPYVSQCLRLSEEKGLPYGKITTPSGNQLVETYQIYGLFLDPTGSESIGFGILSMTSMKIKPTKNWLTTLRTTLKGKIPLLAYRTVLGTVKEKNDKGTFYNPTFKPLGETWVASAVPPDSALLEEVSQFREMIESGAAKVDMSKQSNDAGSGKADDEIPF